MIRLRTWNLKFNTIPAAILIRDSGSSRNSGISPLILSQNCCEAAPVCIIIPAASRPPCLSSHEEIRERTNSNSLTSMETMTSSWTSCSNSFSLLRPFSRSSLFLLRRRRSHSAAGSSMDIVGQSAKCFVVKDWAVHSLARHTHW